MGYLNKVILIGRLGQDPEKRITPSGHTVINISLATTEYFKDQGGNKQERTEWHRVVFWNRQAELIEQYCTKGSQIYVEGSLQTREWQDKDGNKRFSTDIVVRNIQLLDSRPDNDPSTKSAANPLSTETPWEKPGPDDPDEPPF
jgi:single-strand DNA-binding protein